MTSSSFWIQDISPVETGAHEDLLVELRRLCQEGGFVEVLDLEELRSSLRSGGVDLGGVDLVEAVLADALLDELDHHGLELEDGPDLGLPEVHEPVVETGVHLHVDLVHDSQGEGGGGLGVDLDCGGDDLEAERGLVAGLDLSGDGDDALPGELGELLEQGGVDLLLGEGDLDGAEPVPEGDEGDASEGPDVLDPSLDGGGAVLDGDVAGISDCSHVNCP